MLFSMERIHNPSSGQMEASV
uniref:Uncharacterized protein n=1 Tax=Anguilla anguilla TaxID=7936 RepID=A0A0E9VTU6_ANGAN